MATVSRGWLSIHDEQLRADGRSRAVRLRIIRNLVAHSGPECEAAPVLQLGLQLTCDTQEHVSLRAPVVGKVTRRVLDHPYPDGTELLSPPIGHALFAGLLGRLNRAPIGDGK